MDDLGDRGRRDAGGMALRQIIGQPLVTGLTPIQLGIPSG